MKRDLKKSVTILVSESGRERMDTVMSALKSAGLLRAKCQRELGTITGESTEANLSRLRAVAGVEAVEAGGSFQLPPPESPLQ